MCTWRRPGQYFPAHATRPRRLFRLRTAVGFISIALLAISGLAPKALGGTLTAADYESREIEGWTVWVEKSLDTCARKDAALELLAHKLADIAKTIPPQAVPKLCKIPIWLSRNVAHGAMYHPSAQWLKDNGRVVEMKQSIEITSIDDFIDWSPIQPEMLLHELAHAWNDQRIPLGYGNPVVKEAFDAAVASGKYESVHYHDGQMRRHYALTNPMEYFAECTEAYFGRNDFEPFNQEELKAFDPTGYRMVRKLWGIDP